MWRFTLSAHRPVSWLSRGFRPGGERAVNCKIDLHANKAPPDVVPLSMLTSRRAAAAKIRLSEPNCR